PGEIAGFGEGDRAAAAAFVADSAATRVPGQALVRVESVGGQVGHRRMRVAVINDDMPFLVDSVAAAVAASGPITYRLLHPVVTASRDDEGTLTAINEPGAGGQDHRESIIYMEVDRLDSRRRQALAGELEHTLADVRAAVSDWRAMQAQMGQDADGLAD